MSYFQLLYIFDLISMMRESVNISVFKMEVINILIVLNLVTLVSSAQVAHCVSSTEMQVKTYVNKTKTF